MNLRGKVSKNSFVILLSTTVIVFFVVYNDEGLRRKLAVPSINYRTTNRNGCNTEVAFVVLLKDINNQKEYSFAQNTVKCYAKSKGIAYYLIVNDANNTKGCNQPDYMYQRHCVLANFMNTTCHTWFVMLDADMGVINPNNTIDKFLPKDDSTFLVFTNRVMNDEIMTGSYIIRNNKDGRNFLQKWANSNSQYAKKIGRDNAAVHSVLINTYHNELIPALSKCEIWWTAAKSFCKLFLYEACVRVLIGSSEFPGIQFLPKTYSYVRDGWLTGSEFSEDDFIFHNWKQSVKNNRRKFGWWNFQFTNSSFSDMAQCNGANAHVLWDYLPGFQKNVTNIRERLNKWKKQTEKEHAHRLTQSLTFNLTALKSCS